MVTKINEINLDNTGLTLKVLKFLQLYKKMGDFSISEEKILEILVSFDKIIKKKSVTN